jgi:glutathione S-transferase
MLAEELGLAYDLKDVQFSDVKKPEFLAVNPNGRMPAIHDPNTDLTLWESGAIIEYMIEKYDTERKVSFEPGSKEAYLAKQWLFYQGMFPIHSLVFYGSEMLMWYAVTGQGPYYGQAVWFTRFHAEQIESAKERYYAEIKRVTSVLEQHLKSQPKGEDGPWLVGGKYSFADMSFVPWQGYASQLTDVSEYTEVAAWLEKMKTRKAIKVVLDEQ